MPVGYLHESNTSLPEFAAYSLSLGVWCYLERMNHNFQSY